MTATLISNSNLTARRLDWVTDLGLGAAAFGTDEQRYSNDIKTPVPLNIIFKIKLTAGALTINYVIWSGTGSPSFTASPLAITGTNWAAIEFQTTLVAPVFRLSALSVGAACVVGKGAGRMEGLLDATGYHEAVAAFNGLDPTTGGVFSDTL